MRPRKLTRRRIKKIIENCHHFYAWSNTNSRKQFDLIAFDNRSGIENWGSDFAPHVRIREFRRRAFMKLWFETCEHFRNSDDKWDGCVYIIRNGKTRKFRS